MHVLALAAALALAAPPAPPAAPALRLAATLADEEDPLTEDGEDGGEDEEDSRRLFVSAWGGTALEGGGSGRSHSFGGGEIAWAFEPVDVGIAGYGYRDLEEDGPEWSPVVLLRLTERFRTRRGLEATLAFGVGAAKPDGWTSWVQLALGVRVPLGPLFIGGEVGFERYDMLRLAAGVGVGF